MKKRSKLQPHSNSSKRLNLHSPPPRIPQHAPAHLPRLPPRASTPQPRVTATHPPISQIASRSNRTLNFRPASRGHSTSPPPPAIINRLGGEDVNRRVRLACPDRPGRGCFMVSRLAAMRARVARVPRFRLGPVEWPAEQLAGRMRAGFVNCARRA